MHKLALAVIAAAVLGSASLASAQSFGPAAMGGFAGTQATLPAGGNPWAAWPMFGFGTQAVGQPVGQAAAAPALQGDAAGQDLWSFMSMLQLFGLK